VNAAASAAEAVAPDVAARDAEDAMPVSVAQVAAQVAAEIDRVDPAPRARIRHRDLMSRQM
jgi:hypothetical protein